MWRAKQQGSTEYFGWDALEYALQNVDDRLQGLHNMMAVQGSRKRPRPIVPAYRPSTTVKQATDLEDFDFSGIE